LCRRIPRLIDAFLSEGGTSWCVSENIYIRAFKAVRHSTAQEIAVSSSYAQQGRASRPDIGARRQASWVAAITLLTHLLILVYDQATAFRAFTWGDRGWSACAS
jgi:hypothetical protein